MADETDGTANKKRFQNIALACAGIAACVVGVLAGSLISSGSPDPSGDNTSALSDNPQTDETPSPDPPFNSDNTDAADVATDEFTDEPVSNGAPVSEAMQSFAADNAGQVSSRAAHVALADEELRAGNFARAVRIYSAAMDQASEIEEASLRYRLALCAESEGDYAGARRQYQQLAARFPMVGWVNAARLGEARCFAAQGRLEGLAEGTLRQALVDETRFSQRVRGELFHLAGRAYCRAFLNTDPASLLDDSVLLMPKWVTDPNRQLELLPVLLKERPSDPGKVGFDITQQTDRLPDSIYVRAATPVSDLKLLLQAVCKRTGFQCDLSESAIAAMADRTQQVYVNDMSLSLLLDGLCTPFGLMWTHEDQSIVIRTIEEVQSDAFLEYRKALGMRLLKFAMVLSPESRQSGYSRVALGILQHHSGDTVDAAYTFRMQMELDPRSEVEAEASLNLGKCRLALGQFHEARQAFLTAVDSASHHLEARVGAYLYFGRLQVEGGSVKPAISSFVRTLALCRGTQFEPRASVLLASAYLISGSPQGASSVLMERREDLDDGQVRSAAAFLSAYARFQAAVLPAPRERAARSLVTAMTRFNPDTEFGAHWAFLKAQACEELGLNEQAVAAYLKTIQQLPDAPLRHQAVLKLANQYRYSDRLDDAAELLAGVGSDREAELAEQIALQSALLALKQGQPATAVKQCRFIVRNTENTELQRSALQAMGRAYEMQEDHKSAVYCFAGMLPAQDSVTDESADSANSGRTGP